MFAKYSLLFVKSCKAYKNRSRSTVEYKVACFSVCLTHGVNLFCGCSLTAVFL